MRINKGRVESEERDEGEERRKGDDENGGKVKKQGEGNYRKPEKYEGKISRL